VTGDREMVMPFVACQSAGGPYDDLAFCAGYSCGMVDVMLSTGTLARYEDAVRVDTIAQLDLIAMRHGYLLATVPDTEDDGWVRVVFTRQANNDAPGGNQ
jgi:hypothetical protein